jgi:hypothetical protein
MRMRWEEDVISELVICTQRKFVGCGFDGLVSGDDRSSLKNRRPFVTHEVLQRKRVSFRIT